MSLSVQIPTVWHLPADPIGAVAILYRNDLGSDADHWGDGIYGPIGGSGWVMIVDDMGSVVDFVAWGYDEQQIRDISLDIGPLRNITLDYAWLGDPAANSEWGDLFM